MTAGDEYVDPRNGNEKILSSVLPRHVSVVGSRVWR